MIRLQPVHSDPEIERLAHLAREIWHEYFPAIIGQAQVDYMVDKFQSVPALREQLAQGYRYYLVTTGEHICGYTGLLPHPGDGVLQLSKLYIRKPYRGRGIGTETLVLIASMAQQQQLACIRLTVNRHNHDSIRAYEHMGFIITGTRVQEIGRGFTMDDYLMEKRLRTAENGSPGHAS